MKKTTALFLTLISSVSGMETERFAKSYEGIRSLKISTACNVTLTALEEDGPVSIETAKSREFLKDFDVLQNGRHLELIEKNPKIKNNSVVCMSSVTVYGYGNSRNVFQSNRQPVQTEETPLVELFISYPLSVAFDLSVLGGFWQANKTAGQLTVMAQAGELNIGNHTGDSNLIINGSGEIKIKELSGTSVDSKIQGSGDIDIENIQVQDGSFSIMGSGDIGIDDGDIKKLSASIMGSGDFNFKGEAKVASFNIMGSGDIKVHQVSDQILRETIMGGGEIKIKKRPNGQPKPARTQRENTSIGNTVVYGNRYVSNNGTTINGREATPEEVAQIQATVQNAMQSAFGGFGNNYRSW